MTDARKPSIFRWIHIVFGIPMMVTFTAPSKSFGTTRLLFEYAAFPMIVTFGIVDVESPPGATNCFKTLVRRI